MFKRMGFKSSLPSQAKKPAGAATFSCKLCKERIVLSQLSEHQKYCSKGENPLPKPEPEVQPVSATRKRIIQDSDSESDAERPRKVVKVANARPEPTRVTKVKEENHLNKGSPKQKESEVKLSNSKKVNKSGSVTQPAKGKPSKEKLIVEEEEESSHDESSSSIDSTEDSEDSSSESSDDRTPLAKVVVPKKNKEAKKGSRKENVHSNEKRTGATTNHGDNVGGKSPLGSPKCGFCSKEFETAKSVTSHYASCKVRVALKAIGSQISSKKSENVSEVVVKEESSDDGEKKTNIATKTEAKKNQALPEKAAGSSGKDAEKKANPEPRGSKKLSTHRETPLRATKSVPLKGRTSSARAAKSRNNGDIYTDDELEKAETTLIIFNRKSLLKRLVATTTQGDPNIFLSRTVSV